MPKRKKTQVTQLNAEHCTKCHQGSLTYIQTGQYFFMLSILPFIVAIVLTFVVHPIFLAFIPFIAWMNFKSAKKKTPLRRCTNCHHIMTPQQLTHQA
ncbi:hypothetical protein [Alkalihalophilus marmarensis]|uniref:hypothetical protein n=1 Tax=Alkalihalophilus marmarensis TaxID=521377 RepID=UPI002E22DE45|nr:hypothetical protein [Alkalihalophilus marmarensis]